MQHALVLTTLNADMTDAQGNKYPDEGEFIESSNFIPNKRLTNGLWGVLWGKTLGSVYLKSEENSIWVVVKIDFNERYINLDTIYNFIKFERGLVVKAGTKKDCADYIVHYKRENKIEDLLDFQIAGNILSSALPNLHALCFGFSGRAESDISGLHAITAAIDTTAVTTKPVSNALSLTSHGRAVTFEENAHAIALGHHSVARTCGRGSLAIALGTNSKAVCTGSESIALCLSAGCEAAVGRGGRGGIIIMVYLEDGEQKVIVESTNSMIIANRMYHYEDNGLSLIH